MAIELEDDHYQSHDGEPDPDCAECRERWDWYGEAVRIVEGDSLLITSSKHLEAAVIRVQERELAISALKNLLRDITAAADLSRPLLNRINNALTLF